LNFVLPHETLRYISRVAGGAVQGWVLRLGVGIEDSTGTKKRAPASPIRTSCGAMDLQVVAVGSAAPGVLEPAGQVSGNAPRQFFNPGTFLNSGSSETEPRPDSSGRGCYLVV
jgi:hypothetical protein